MLVKASNQTYGRRVKRIVAGALTLAALAGAARLAPVIRRKAAAAAVVPAELRTPAMFMPLHLVTPAIARFVRSLPMPAYEFPSHIRHEVRTVAGRDGRPDVRLHLYQRGDRPRPSGVLYWIHGGGFVIGTPEMSHPFCSRVADELNVLVVSVDYRLAPENPFPEGIEDCYTGLCWTRDQADELGVDVSRIAVGGDSAGGGLAACLAQLSHDRHEVELCFQLLVYPMLDDRTVLRSDDAGTGEFVWSAASNRFGWTSYLGHPPVAETAAAYAVGARRTDLTGLPPAWIGIGDIDLFHAEGVAYAERLSAAGVPCDLLVVPGMYHGADGFPGAAESPPMVAFNQAKVDALRAALLDRHP